LFCFALFFFGAPGSSILIGRSLFFGVFLPIDPLADNPLSWLARPSPGGGSWALLGQ
jgi:hypothetical protein